MDGNQPYRPIACDFHDRLEALATLRQRVEITLVPSSADAPAGAPLQGRIRDLYTAESKEEFLLLDDGTALRLDRIQAIRPAP